ncbi:MAG: ribosomal protein S18-alanine N-acetyltransferase [Erysipelotrichaceae bacterium]|nr:ribosomal protein S18-alanine N-acetyltransferase [Erysipelotrichaceae bacterium]
MIRTMKEEDLKEAARLDSLCFKDSWSLEDFEKDFRDNPFFNGILIEEDGKILGYATFWTTFENAQLVRLGVDPDCRHQGLGGYLLNECEEKAKESGCEIFSLDVRAGNGSARTLYEHNGLHQLHVSKGYYPDGEDAIVMAKGL